MESRHEVQPLPAWAGPQDTAWATRAEAVLAGGAATLSKNVNRFGVGTVPTVLTRGDGAYVWTTDGTRLLDTIAGLGPILLGYGHPAVQAAVHAQVDDGASFSLLHPLEVEVAELICALVPSVERVRFAKNGGDVTEAAVRLARYDTGRQHIVCCGYHGKSDWYISTTANGGGLLAEVGGYTHQLPWGDMRRWEAAAQEYAGDLAAMIIEIPPLPGGEDAGSFARFVESLARQYGAVFILDEVVSGWRYGLGGLQARFELHPDLTCFGKALANGYPLAALGGRADLMAPLDGRVFLSTTNGGEAVGLAAAKATLETLRQTDALEILAEQGTTLAEGLAWGLSQTELPVTLLGDHARLAFRWHDVPEVATAAELKTAWIAEHARRGILYGGPLFPMTCYTDATVTTLLTAAAEVCVVLRQAINTHTVQALLPGTPLVDVFGERYARLDPH